MKFLLIGNSHIFYNDMGAMLAALTGAEVTLQTTGGADLLFHREQTDVRFNILYGGYDGIVLQNRQQPVPAMEEHLLGLEGLMEWIRQTNSIPLGYETWSIPGKPDTLPAQKSLWEEAKRVYGMDYAPVGEAFRRAEGSGIDLYGPDRRHASPAGSYLIALCLARGLTGRPVTDLPGKLSCRGHSLIALTAKEASPLRVACEEAYENKG